jgi:hypothetical protein
MHLFKIIMKISEIIQEFMPCEVCGNSDVHKFYFHVVVHKGSQPYVKCCQCEEEYYSIRAKKVMKGVVDAFRVKTHSNPVHMVDNFKRQECTHPLIKALSRI